MTETVPAPALAEFARWVRAQGGVDFVEVRVASAESHFELRHIVDAERPAAELRRIAVDELRPLAQTTAAGEFRPIKTAPNLVSGWHCIPADAVELGLALDALYPGAVTDWWAASTQSPPPVQHYREFTGRQTGMYRIAQQLTDAEAAAVIQAGCAPQFCLRRRLWTVEGCPPDGAGAGPGKSIVPCLEPCPLMLEFARRARRLIQAEPLNLQPPLVADECATVVAALEIALAHPAAEVREGDLSHPANPRRIRLLRDRLQGLLPGNPGSGTEE